MDTTCQSRTAIKNNQLFLGIDVGTSGIRTCVIDNTKNIVDFYALPFNTAHQYDAQHWWHTLKQLLARLHSKHLTAQIKSISIDGTSGTLLALNKNKKILGKPIMYFKNPALASTPYLLNLPNLNAYLKQYPTLKKALFLKATFNQQIACYMHQADWVAFKLSKSAPFSDYHNCLKLGFNPQKNQWSKTVSMLLGIQHLPKVLPPGKKVALFNLPKFALQHCQLTSGTTDSNAAFIACDITKLGYALTSLGTTLVLKVFSPIKIESEKHGVYSHKYKNGWIVSGASNCGAGILKKYFTDDEIHTFSKQLQPNIPTGLNYYPLTCQGERFPIADAHKQPLLTPAPKNKALFFQAILESLAQIEQQGYLLLQQLGAPKIKHIVTAGGGANNIKWQQIRQNINHVKISKAKNNDAAFGASLLALESYNDQT